MNQKITAGLLAVAASAVFAGSAHAQLPNVTPFSFEVRGGAALPQGDFGDVTETGLNLSGTVTFHAFPIVGIYGGYSHNSFGFNDGTEALLGEGTVSISGPRAGARLSIPTPLIPIDPYVEAGVLYGKLEADFKEAGEEGETDSEVGFEVGAGVGFNILPKIQLTPAVGFTSISFEDEDTQFFTAGVGLRIRL